MSGLGYRQICQHLAGKLTLEEAAQEIKRKTRRFVQQQGTWFRPDDPLIRWFDLSIASREEIERALRRWLAGQKHDADSDHES
jgi:tRNA dimethylallyltransferase